MQYFFAGIANGSITLWKFLNLTDRRRNTNEGNNEILLDTYQMEKKFNCDKSIDIGEAEKNEAPPTTGENVKGHSLWKAM